MRGLAINVGANTTLPGFRGPIHPDGTFVYVPIPERRPTAEPVPTYADLDLPIDIPDEHLETRVHLDPTFASYPTCSDYTYGDEHGVKAGRLSELHAGDVVFFYATLSTSGEPERRWIPPTWGAYVIGHFRLADDPLTDAHVDGLSSVDRRRFATNAHVKRETLDARVLLRGDPDGSELYRVPIPLSRPSAGADPGPLVTEVSDDSGRGPWWRRPLSFPDASVVLDRRESGVAAEHTD